MGYPRIRESSGKCRIDRPPKLSHILSAVVCGLHNRLFLMINWAWAYLFGEHGVRLIAPAELPPGKHGLPRTPKKVRT